MEEPYIQNYYLAIDNISPDTNGDVVSILSTEEHMDNTVTCNTINLQTSKYLTDIISNNYNLNDFHAFKFCRDLKVSEFSNYGCDLPSIDVLMRIYQSRTIIDNLDPTVIHNNDFNLTDWFLSAEDGAYAHASSERYNEWGEYAWRISSKGAIDGWRSDGKSWRWGVIPCLEIPAE